MKQEKFDDYVAKMDSILEELKNDFSEQLKTDDNVEYIEYKIWVGVGGITLDKKTEKINYLNKQLEEETRVLHIAKRRMEKLW